MGRKTDLPQPLAHYATRYGVAVDSIKRWRTLARQKGDPCPLDDPSDLIAWWGRCMSYACPDNILAATTPELPAAPQSQPPPTSASPEPSQDLDSLGLSPEEELRMSAATLRAAYNRLQHAYDSAPTTIPACAKALAAEQATHARVKASVEKHRLTGGNYLPRASVEQDLARLAQMIADLDAASARRLIESCPSLTPEASAELRAALDRDSAHRAQLLRNLNGPTPLTLAA